ncbi:MAG: group-specific protein [Acidiferrobacteraceae bacterium]|nr:group-specific protein [Acidiferrobacteraceae bacterium]
MFVFGGVVYHAFFHIIGSEVDIYGVLREPFPLLPLGYLLYLLGIGIYVWNWISGRKKSKKYKLNRP